MLLQTLDGALAALEAGTGQVEHHVEAALAEVEDLISYCNDIMDTGADAPPAVLACPAVPSDGALLGPKPPELSLRSPLAPFLQVNDVETLNASECVLQGRQRKACVQSAECMVSR